MTDKMSVRFIGDVHGVVGSYVELVRECRVSRQVGDMGIGFDREYDQLYRRMMESNLRGDHRFIRGNHDNPHKVGQFNQWIPDGTFDEELSIFYIGGARSYDRELRMEGRDWWPQEELNDHEWRDMLDWFVARRPRVMVTHDCPQEVAIQMRLHQGKAMRIETSTTRLWLQTLWGAHRPEHWVFGHWHETWEQAIDGTRFQCVGELEAVDLDLEVSNGG